jgi:4-aminobutyrate aminotransferase/(S)-3-amino-2-methylpropionate transaminase
LETFDAEKLATRGKRLGEIFERATKDWFERFSLIGDIRGVGAMRALELVRDRRTREPAKEETEAVLRACYERGLLILPAGTHGNVIRLLAPLVAADEQIEEGLAVLETALVQVSQVVSQASR